MYARQSWKGGQVLFYKKLSLVKICVQKLVTNFFPNERISFWTNAEETNFSLIYYEYTYTRIVSNIFRAIHGRKININLLLNKLLLLSKLHFYVTN